MGRIKSDLWKDLRLSASGGKDCSLVWVRVGILCEMGGFKRVQYHEEIDRSRREQSCQYNLLSNRKQKFKIFSNSVATRSLAKPENIISPRQIPFLTYT